MKTAYGRVVWTVGLVGLSCAALAGEPKKVASPQEPMGFVTGGIIGGFAAGPAGAVIGAGIGTWLGNRVHRAGDAPRAEAQAAVLAARFDQLANNGAARSDAATVLDGLQGDVLFKTGSADVAPEMTPGIRSLAAAVAKSPALKVRLDGYADPRGSIEGNLQLSAQRANAVRDLFLAAGVPVDALEINAYGKTYSVAADPDGYALERRVRLTVQAEEHPAGQRFGAVTTPPASAPPTAREAALQPPRDE